MKLVSKEAYGSTTVEYQGILISFDSSTKTINGIDIEDTANINTLINMLNDIKYGRVENLDESSDDLESINEILNKLS